MRRAADLVDALGRWLYDRLGLDVLRRAVARHKVPSQVGIGRQGWMYVFGNATLVMLLVQIVGGVALATLYIPSPATAHQSLIEINERATLGSFLRGLHFYGASAMVVLMLMHLVRVYLTAAYKYPREGTWMSGVVLLVLVMMMAFTGQLLRWDENGLWGAVVAAEYVRRIPVLGAHLADFVLAGETISGATLSRFFALHVFILPALIFSCLGVHLFLVLTHGVSEPPRAGRLVEPATYRRRYERLKEEGVTYWPHVVWREALFALFVFAVVLTLVLVYGPKGPGAPPDPARMATDPKPDWFLLWWYALLWLKPRGLEAFVMVYAPLLALLLAFFLPVFFNRGERSPTRRPWAVALVLLVVGSFVTLTVLGSRAPWFPERTEPLSAAVMGTNRPEVLGGAAAFNERGCQICHAVLESGGDYGPDLTRVALRLSREDIALRIMNGMGDMPAYREIVSRQELAEILVFLQALSERGAP